MTKQTLSERLEGLANRLDCPGYDHESPLVLEAQSAIDEAVKALQAAQSAGSYVVKLIEANDKAGQSANSFERADWIGTCAHAYGAMAFVSETSKALTKLTQSK